jgi:hypothetical protein
MRKKFIFWLAKILKVDIFKKQTTEITHRTTGVQFSTIEIKKIISQHELRRRIEQGIDFLDLKNELAVELANRLINEDKVLIEQFKKDIDQTQHIRLVVEIADQKQ